ncbi:MAG: glycerol kinase GlpK [Sulfurospirillum sp.]
MKCVLAIDQGTTSSRAILFDQKMEIVAVSQKEFSQHFPFSGWVEHDPEDIYDTVISTCRDVIEKASISMKDIISIGITNQRETTLVWDKKTGKTIYNAIVWQDRRTSAYCNILKDQGYENLVKGKTGLLLDPYFSGTKLKWILENVDDAKQRADRGELLFGTIDSYLIWKLTGGKSHFCDATNAARTMLYNIKTGGWDEEICSLLEIPMSMLPEVKNCADDFGYTSKDLFGEELQICGVAGDQQAATIGQACFEPGMLKSTYGTGCFALLNTGFDMVLSNNRLLTTIAYQLEGKTTYALEGSIFVAGAVVQWLRDGPGIIKKASEAQELAKKADKEQNLYIVPAFTGMGAPYWDADCRGAIFGLTRNSGPAEFSKAALQSVGYQTKDLLEAMYSDLTTHSNLSEKNPILRVDGGMSASDWTIEFLSDILGVKVDRPKILETTALGVAWLAGMFKNFYPKQEEFAKNWALQRRFEPNMDDYTRDKLYRGWKDAVSRTLSRRQK